MSESSEEYEEDEWEAPTFLDKLDVMVNRVGNFQKQFSAKKPMKCNDKEVKDQNRSKEVSGMKRGINELFSSHIRGSFDHYKEKL